MRIASGDYLKAESLLYQIVRTSLLPKSAYTSGRDALEPEVLALSVPHIRQFDGEKRFEREVSGLSAGNDGPLNVGREEGEVAEMPLVCAWDGVILPCLRGTTLSQPRLAAERHF